MWMLFKAFFCVVLTFLNIFTWPVFGFMQVKIIMR